MSEDRARSGGTELPKAPRCPLCGKPREQRYRPFCSARCRDVDLGRWFDQAYSVPAAEPGYDEEDQ
jgi:endogenous inhibitor of DNA gyrase (YacG/DUF329 family)